MAHSDNSARIHPHRHGWISLTAHLNGSKFFRPFPNTKPSKLRNKLKICNSRVPREWNLMGGHLVGRIYYVSTFPSSCPTNPPTASSITTTMIQENRTLPSVPSCEGHPPICFLKRPTLATTLLARILPIFRISKSNLIARANVVTM
jgi:hypothetical protein